MTEVSLLRLFGVCEFDLEGYDLNTATTRAYLLSSTMIAGVAVLALSTSAFAQATGLVASGQSTPDAAESSGGATVQELVVTGSRIPQPNLTSVSPITAVNQAAIQLQGANDAVDILNQLPQNGIGVAGTASPLSSAAGFTTANLRNLGSVRTLVLIDGKRLMPGDPTLAGEAADLDTVPSQLVDRVEVVTGGASATYGSDAIAGVVNFILKKNFQGLQIDAQYGVDTHYNGLDDVTRAQAQNLNVYGPAVPAGEVAVGQTYNAAVTLGMNSADGKGNVTGYFAYRHQDPIRQAQYDFGACLAQLSGTGIVCAGSSNSNLFFDENSGQTYSVQGSNFIVRNPNQVTTPPYKFDSSPYEFLVRGDERYQAGFLAHYDLSTYAEAYADFSFMDDRSLSVIAPGGLFQNGFSVNCNNPLLSAQQINAICTSNGLSSTDDASLLIGRRDVEGGPRTTSFEHTSYRAIIGMRGDLGDGWSYDAYGQFGYTSYFNSQQGYLSNARVQNALLVGGTAANPVCLSGGACVPYNIFSDGGVTPAALSYLLTGGTISGDTQEQVVSANVTGDLSHYGLKSPFASTGVGINFGAEYRREGLVFAPDQTISSGDLLGGSGASSPVDGAFDVKELFGEARLPLAQDIPFIKDLTLDGGYRFSRYSSAGNTNAYKFAVEYSPTSDIRFRGSFQRAIRAPNVNELFTPEEVGQTGVFTVDPCAPVGDAAHTGATATLAQCKNTGVTAAQYGDGRDPAIGGTDKIPQCPAFQCGAATGGNLALKPEDSDTYSVGAVVTPRFIPGFTFSADYFSIKINNVITTIPVNIIFNTCLTADQNCSLIVRRPDSGAIFASTTLASGGYIVGTNVNGGFLKTTGVDFTASYRMGLDRFGLKDLGGLVFDFNATYTRSFVDQPVPGGATYDCAGLYGATCGFQPSYRHKLRITYNSPWNLGISGAWRFIGPMSLDQNTSQPLLAGNYDAYDGHVGGVSYFDLTATYKVKPGVAVRIGANNIFDKDPPILTAAVTGNSGNPNTNPVAYEVLGRQIFVGLTADF
jgi:iron complex outermembrane receptor protein